MGQNDRDDCCLPLGAQHQENDGNSNNQHDCQEHDAEEDDHFQQVCKSYQQYATFHQTRQQGVNRRMCQLLNSLKPVGDDNGPTIQSILPLSLLPQTLENQHEQKQFCKATIRNQFFLDNVLKYSEVMTSQEVLRQRKQSNDDPEEGAITMMEWVTEDQVSKIDSVLKSLARDWSREGREERSVVYDRLVGALEKYMPLDGSDEHDNPSTTNMPPRVAVPGSGLGRLAWEIYSRGYTVQGSDFSMPMLLASDFILNGCGLPEGEADGSSDRGSSSFRQFEISPWISETKNTPSFQHRISTVIVPDVDPTSLHCNQNDDDDDRYAAPEFTMIAGEFLSNYSHFLPDHKQSHDNGHQHPNSTKKFHAIACSFFLDTAPSLPHYLLTIYHMLEDGGLLLNFGPLMYHWSGHGGLCPGDLDTSTNSNGGDSYVSSMYQKRHKHLDPRYLSSIDYTWEEVRYMILQCGFEIVEEEMYIPAPYTSDAKSMMKVVYDCVFLVARKKPKPTK